MLKFLLKQTSTSAVITKVLKGFNDFNAKIKAKNQFFSSHSSSTSSSTEITPKKDALYHKLIPCDPSISVIPIIDRWVNQGKPIEQHDLTKIITQLRNYKRFKHALEISEWMEDVKLFDLTPGAVAVRLDLISKVHGVEQAEKYFNNIPESLRVLEVYGALLNCYADSKSLEKAENIMQKMRELDYCKLLSYTVMMNLYSQMGKDDKINSLMKEMAEKGIDCDKYPFNIRLNGYGTASDVEGMEKLLMKMEADPSITMDWNTYVIAAKSYLKAGDTGKAAEVLKKSEQLIWGSNVNSGYQVLLTLYANAGMKRDVYRIWHLLKKFGKVRNRNYLFMIRSLEKLDDVKGAEKIVEEWLANNAYFDIRIPHFLITAYCKRGHMGTAEMFIKRLTNGGYKPHVSTWYRMARGYYKCNDKDKAVEMIKKAIEISYHGVKIDFFTLALCVEYLKEKGDIDEAEELIQELEKRGPFSVDIRERVMSYINKGSLAFEELTLGRRG